MWKRRSSFEIENYDGRNPKKRRRDSHGGEIPELYSIFLCEVASVQNYGAFMKIPSFWKQGLVHKSQMSKSRVDDASEIISVGEKVYCKVISILNDGEKIGLSMKLVNQSTGKDLDPNNVELSLDDKKRKPGQLVKPKIELGAVLDTTCKKCGCRGHLAKDCFNTRDGKAYEIIPEFDPDNLPSPSIHTKSKKKRKEKRKHKKKKKKDTKNEKKNAKTRKVKHHKKRRERSISSSSDASS